MAVTLEQLLAQQNALSARQRYRGEVAALPPVAPAAPVPAVVPGVPLNPVVRTTYAGGPTTRPSAAPAVPDVTIPMPDVSNVAAAPRAPTSGIARAAQARKAPTPRQSRPAGPRGPRSSGTADFSTLVPTGRTVGGARIPTYTRAAPELPTLATQAPLVGAVPTIAAPDVSNVTETVGEIAARLRAENPVGQVPAPAVTPATPVVRGNRFDVTNTDTATGAARGGGFVNPNVNYASIPVPASLAAPQFGGAPVPAAGAGPSVITIGDSAADPLNPTGRMFDPVAARFALRNREQDVALQNAQLAAETQRANALLGAQAGLAQAQVAGQFGLQERALANEGALASAELSGQYGVEQARITQMLKARQAQEEARLAAQGRAGTEAKNMTQAELMRLQLLAARQIQATDPNNPERLAAAVRTGQAPQTVLADSMSGQLIGVATPGVVNTTAARLQAEQAEQARLRARLAP